MISNELLKRRILDMAIHGTLVENDLSLDSIDVESITGDIPFGIPSNWKWCRIGNISTYQNGFAFNSNMMTKNLNKGYPVIKSANIGSKEVIINSKTDFIEKPTDKMLEYIINKNDILMVLSSQSANIEPLGISAIYKLDSPSLLNQRVLKIVAKSNLISPDYLLFLINSDWFHKKLSSKAAGLAQANLKLEHVFLMEVPLPPIEEQYKIVAKIEELFECIDKKEKNDQEKINLKNILKKKILDSAICGELIENDLSLRPVDVEQITGDIPFEIPSNWKWSTFGMAAIKITDGTHSTPNYVTSGIPFLSVKDISSGKLNFNNCKYITIEEHQNLYKRCDPKKNDLLITKVGTTGIPVIVDTNEEFSLFVSVALLRFDLDKYSIEYLKYIVSSRFIQNIIDENTKGMANKNWVIKEISKTPIPLPPLEQQRKIVNKIEECFNLIDQL